MHLWHELLDRAIADEQVVDIAQDYVSSLTATDLVNVPTDCRPHEILDESDVDYWNLRLADECRTVWGTDRDGRMLTEMSQFFLYASVRLSRIKEHQENNASVTDEGRFSLH